MVSVSQRTSRRDGVTFVHVVVENQSSERRRVRLAVDVERGPWPPRRHGVPESGWDDAGVTVTVAAGNARGVGFATPAPVEGDAVTVVADDPAAGSETPEASAAGVVRALGGFAPPLAATPREDDAAVDEARSDERGGRRVRDASAGRRS